MVRKLKWGERDLDEDFKDAALLAIDAQREFEAEDTTPERRRELYEKLMEAQEGQLSLLMPFIVEWNWVDDDDKTMPLPSEAGRIEVTREEAVWLIENIRPVLFPEQSEKN